MTTDNAGSTKAQWLTIEPIEDHKQTFIFLHGRGATAILFKAGLLNTCLLDGLVLTERFPHARWIFPQAPLESLAAAEGVKFYQWFDVWSLKPGSEETDLQIPGLQGTVEVIHDILRCEIATVGAHNVVLGGLSQGCASSLIASLLWEGEPFAACIGMCGWLPFRNLLESATRTTSEDGQEGKHPARSSTQNVIQVLRNKLSYASSTKTSFPFEKIPFFLGHGADDWKVLTVLGEEAATCLKKAGADVEYKEYEDLEHWYNDAMLSDVSDFIELNLN